jgi:uncharacterized protein (UPF0332 family)
LVDCEIIIPKLLLNKANDGLKAIEYLRTAGCRVGVISITYVACVNVARSALAYDGHDYEPTTAFEMFKRYYSGTGKFDPNLGELFKVIRRFNHESDFNPLFAIADAEAESLISKTQAFYNDVVEYIRGK